MRDPTLSPFGDCSTRRIPRRDTWNSNVLVLVYLSRLRAARTCYIDDISANPVYVYVFNPYFFSFWVSVWLMLEDLMWCASVFWAFVSLNIFDKKINKRILKLLGRNNCIHMILSKLCHSNYHIEITNKDTDQNNKLTVL